MSGLSRGTGVALAEMDHIRQSIQDILQTLPGERVMRRDYGCWVRALIDAPLDPVTIMDIYQAVVGAINRWEPRVLVQSVGLDEAGGVTGATGAAGPARTDRVTADGRLILSIAVRHRATGQAIRLAGMTV
jgi:hypothetical protein